MHLWREHLVNAIWRGMGAPGRVVREEEQESVSLCGDYFIHTRMVVRWR
jgi:hypothetical protein